MNINVVTHGHTMMEKRSGALALVALCLLTLADAEEYNVDMENTGVCTTTDIQTVLPQDVYNIYANPPNDNKGTRDRCTVKFEGYEGRQLKLFVRDLQFSQCQIFVKMYDGDMHLQQPRFSFGCESGPGNTYQSFNSKVAVSLEKPDPTSTGYKFYMRLATTDGPDIVQSLDRRGEPPSADVLSGGVIAGVVVGALLFVVVGVALIIFCVINYRRKKEEKEAYKHSMSTLLPTGASTRGSSVHSSVHGSVHDSVHSSKHSVHSSYPAFRTTISDKHGQCNSIDTQSHDSERVDGVSKEPVPIKSVHREFDSMRRGFQREKYRQALEAEDLHHQDLRREEAQKADRQSRAESNRGLGRSKRSDHQPIMHDENLKQSLRAARNRGRSFDDKASSRGSTRSKSRNKSRSPSRSTAGYKDSKFDSNYYSDDRYRDRGRTNTRSEGGRSTYRSSSASSYYRRRRDYDEESDHSDYSDRRSRSSHHTTSRDRDRYNDRDAHSDYEGRQRDRHRDRHDDDDHRHRSGSLGQRSSSGQRSGTQRSRSSGRRKR